MQINTSMSVKYYTYYQMNKAEKGSVEFENLVTEGYTEKGNYYSSERGDFTDYQDAKIPDQAEECMALFDFFNSYNKINKEETDIDFSKFAPNAPNEVRQAFAEADSEITNPDYDIPEAGTLLTSESTTCMYETADPDDNDIHYITWYTEEGIFCRKAGQTEGYEWTIPFDNDKQYNKVIDFINQFPRDWNLRFAAHENFWKDFLDGTLDIEGFMEFMNGTNKGIPDFSVTVGESMYIDKDKVQWAKYTNPLESKFFTP